MDIEKIESAPIFKGLERKSVEKFIYNKDFVIKKFNKGDFILQQNSIYSSLYFLYEGSALTYMANSEGKQVDIESLKSPIMIAPAFLFATNNRIPVSVEAETDCSFLIISKAQLSSFMNSEPLAMDNFISAISNRSIFLSNKLRNFALQSLRKRLVKFILENENKLPSQQIIANRIGVARPSLSRVLSELVNEGSIAMEKRKIVIKNRNKLLALLD